MPDVWILKIRKWYYQEMKDMQSLEEINKNIKIKIADINYEVEDPD